MKNFTNEQLYEENYKPFCMLMGKCVRNSRSENLRGQTPEQPPSPPTPIQTSIFLLFHWFRLLFLVSLASQRSAFSWVVSHSSTTTSTPDDPPDACVFLCLLRWRRRSPGRDVRLLQHPTATKIRATLFGYLINRIALFYGIIFS